MAVENAANLHAQGSRVQGSGSAFTHAAALAKLHSTEAAVTATRVATQVLAGSSFIEANPIARFYRDAKIRAIREGTSEIQRSPLSEARHTGVVMSLTTMSEAAPSA